MAQVNAGRVRFVSRGEYNNSTQYYTLDLVNYDGSSYYAKENVVGVLPTDNTKWQLVAEKGSIGSTGATGPSGFSPSASVTQLQNGALISITDENGTTTANIQNGEVTNKEFEYYKTIANVLPKVEDEDTELTLNNTGNAPLSIGLKGNTYQDSTTGKNIIDANNINFISGGNATITRSNNEITVAGTTTTYASCQFLQSDLKLKPSTTYTFSAKIKSTTNTSGSLVYISANISNTGSQKWGTQVTAGNISYATFTTPETISDSAFIGLYTGGTSNTAVFTDIMLEEGSTATEYEPYTNGASPNPDYPQDIQVVSGDNTITISNSDNTQEQVYPINLGNIELCKIGDYQDDIRKSTGKNLFDINTLINPRTTRGIEMSIVNNSMLKLNGTSTQNNLYFTADDNNKVLLKSGTYTFTTNASVNVQLQLKKAISGTTFNINKNSTFTLDEDSYIYNGLIFTVNGTTYNETIWFQIEEGSEATYWEPFGKGKWIKYGAIGKVVLDGSETWTLRTDGTFQVNLSGIFNRALGLSNYFYYSRTSTTTGAFYTVDNYVRFYYTEITTVEGFKNWLVNHNTDLYYQLSTPTITEITDSNLISQLDAIEYAMSYKDQTNISQENNDMAFIIPASAFKDLSNL